MRKLITALAVVTILSLFAIIAFASAPAKALDATGHAAIVLGQSAGEIQGTSSALTAKFDIKNIGFAASAKTIKLGAMDLGGLSGAFGKTIVQSSKSTIVYKEGSTAPDIAACTTTGKTFIAKTSMTDEEDYLVLTYAAEPRGSYTIAGTAAHVPMLL